MITKVEIPRVIYEAASCLDDKNRLEFCDVFIRWAFHFNELYEPDEESNPVVAALMTLAVNIGVVTKED